MKLTIMRRYQALLFILVSVLLSISFFVLAPQPALAQGDCFHTDPPTAQCPGSHPVYCYWPGDIYGDRQCCTTQQACSTAGGSLSGSSWVWYEPPPEAHSTIVYEEVCDSPGLECTVHAVTTAIGNTIDVRLSKPRSQVGAPGLPYRPSTIQLAGGLVGGLIDQRPVSTSKYVRYLAQKTNIVETAYAQGTGFGALEPIIPIWSAFRNVAYIAFVLIFIFVGFMIMFRARLDPQTVVNIQNSIPKLIVTLLLITFSYPIVGFLIDIIYVGIQLILSATSTLFQDGGAVARERILNMNLFDIWFDGRNTAVPTPSDAMARLMENILGQGIIGALAGWASEGIFHLIFVVAVVYSLIKLLIQLLMAYIQIILSTIFSPILLLFNALPGNQSFSNWIRNLLANILIFPAIAAIFLVAAVLIGEDPNQPAPDNNPWNVNLNSGYTQSGVGWLPPFIGIGGGISPQAIFSLIGFGMILFAPQVATMVKEGVKAKPLPVSGVFAPIVAGGRFAGGVGRVAATPITAPLKGAVGLGRTFITGAVGQLGENIFGERQRRQP